MARRRIVLRGGLVRWTWAEDGEFERVLWPVVQSMAEVLVEAADDVRECPGDGTCGWLFVDRTKNRSRRWCSMQTCGNRAKARRYYRRTSQAP
jgi:predicted RNA-binding Zn ribbon-like protein